jgi:hypothetical protein
MKKTILSFILISFLFITSCTKNDTTPVTPAAPKISTMSAKVNGVLKTYNTFSVSDVTGTGTSSNPNYTKFTASINGDVNNLIEFGIYKNQTGLNAKYYIGLKNNSVIYSDSYFFEPDEISINVVTNNATKLTGTFSGTIATEITPKTVIPVTEGTFEYYY